MFNRYRRRIAVLCVLGFGLVTSLRSLHQTRTVNTNVLASEHVAPLERALTPVHHALPMSTTVGFLADPQITPGTYLRLFYATQYVLAPRIVRMIGSTPPELYAEVSLAESPVSSTIPAIVIAYDPLGKLLPGAAERLGLTIIRHLDGQTVLLCRNDALARATCPFER